MYCIYFFLGEKASKWIINDYIHFSFNKCFIFYLEKEKLKISQFLSDFKKDVKPLEFDIEDLDDFIINLNLDDIIREIDGEIKGKSNFKFYLKEIKNLNFKSFSKESLIYKIKILLEKFSIIDEILKSRKKTHKKFIFDLTNLSGFLSFEFYYILLKYRLDNNLSNLEIIVWGDKTNTFQNVPNFFLDQTSQILLDLIASDSSTIKELQQKYSEIKNLEKVVTQPFISKYISKLIKKRLIDEDWIEGFKHFYITDFGNLHYKPDIENYIQLKLKKQNDLDSKEITTSNLVQNLIIANNNKNYLKTKELFKEVLERNDLKEEEIILLIDRFKKGFEEYITKILDKAIKKYPESPEILTLHAKILYKKGETQNLLELCQKIIKLNPNFTEAWDLIGKLVSK